MTQPSATPSQSDSGRQPARRPFNLAGRLDLVTLKLFIAIVEEQSIARAADREFIAASAVSKRIADLEQTMQVQLLQRHRKGIDPTAAGMALLQHARRILGDVSRLEHEIIDYASGASGHVRVLASESALFGYFPRALGSFSRFHPGIRIDLRAEVSPAIVQAVLDNETDLGIFWGDVPTGDLVILPCYSDRLVAVTALDHPLAGETSLRFSQVLDYDVIEQEANSSVQALFLRVAAEVGKPLKTRIRVGGFDAVCSMAAAGLGVGIVPDSFAARLRAAIDISIIALDEPWAARRYKICVRRSDEQPLATRLLVDHLATST